VCVFLLVLWTTQSSRKRSLRWADSSSRGVLPSVCLCLCVCVAEFDQVQQQPSTPTKSTET
jgi:hypothetical protein